MDGSMGRLCIVQGAGVIAFILPARRALRSWGIVAAHGGMGTGQEVRSRLPAEPRSAFFAFPAGHLIAPVLRSGSADHGSDLDEMISII